MRRVISGGNKYSSASSIRFLKEEGYWIFSHASLEEIQSFVEDILDQPELEKTPELVEVCCGVKELQESQKRATLMKSELQRKSDSVVFHVPAFPWTTVTDDSDFVSHLVSLWFTWVHPTLNWINRDLFMQEMRSGNLESEFCSPFLVNIMLADACAYSDYPESYAIASEPWSRGLQFHKEAKRYLEKEEGKISVSYIQGLGILYVCTCLMGKDRSGWIYYGQLAYAVQELSKKHKPPLPDADEDAIRRSQAICHAIWGLFNVASMTALSYQKPCLVKIPKPVFVLGSGEEQQETWTNYPLRSRTAEFHSQCLLIAFCDASAIKYDLSWLLFGDGDIKPKMNPDFVESTERVYDRLRKWYEGLPECLALTNATPHVLSFNLMYHSLIQTMFGFLKDIPKDDEENETEDEEWEAKVRQRANRMCIDAARQSGRIIDMYRDEWTFDRMPPVNVHRITVSMFTLLQDMEEAASREAFVSLSVAAKGFSNRWPLGKAMLRLVQLTAKQMEVKLPQETDALFAHFERRVWSPEDRKTLSSQYPNFAHSMKRGEIDEIDMDAFLAKFDELYAIDDEESIASLVGDDDETENSDSMVDVEIEIGTPCGTELEEEG
ncbi:hypothetical protein N7488_003014 [Penicillium malachiteum]|nr:hypothetical protein N7488_003014 [Penicillium malachiteum]